MTRWHRFTHKKCISICLHPSTKGNSAVCPFANLWRARMSYDNKIGLLAVISLFYNHSQSSVCSVSLTVVSMLCITHSRQYALYHSQSSVCSVSLTVVSMLCITHSRQYALYHSQSSVCSVSLTVVSMLCITHSRQYALYHSQSSVRVQPPYLFTL